MAWHAVSQPLRTEQVASAAERIQRGGQLVVLGAPGEGRSQLLRAVAHRLGERAVPVRVPSGLDRVEATLLSLAASLGPEVLRSVARQLHQEGGQPAGALVLLGGALQGRYLLVDDLDSLQAWARPADRELRAVFEPRLQALKGWLARHAALQVRMRLQARGQAGEALQSLEGGPAPLVVANGATRSLQSLWEAVGYHPLRFRLAVSRALVAEDEHLLEASRDEPLLDELALIADTWERLPEGLRRLVELAGVHGRPLPRDILAELLGSGAEPLLREAARVLLLDEEGLTYIAPRPWVEWCGRLLPLALREQHHRELARAFSSAAPVSAGELKAPYVLEAHRHFLAIPDMARARAYARYGVALLMEHARNLSADRRRFAEAAEVYDTVLSIDRELGGGAEHVAAGVGARARAYALHYYHYNRAKAHLEGLPETERGYEEAQEGWPENALFWSRLALTRFYQHRAGEAHATLERARQQVPEHPDKSHALVGRTALKLLRRGQDFYADALAVWGSHRPVGAHEHEAYEQLVQALAQGWACQRLAAPGQQDIHLHQLVHVRLLRSQSGFVCELEEVPQLVTRGASPLEAYQACMQQIRERTSRLLRSLSHALTEQERREKQRLLGWVDLAASHLLEQVPDATWVYGHVDRDPRSGELCFHAMGSRPGSFPLLPELAAQVTPDDRKRFAQVKAGQGGQPVGPVLKLEEPLPLTPEQVWSEWRRRMTHGA